MNATQPHTYTSTSSQGPTFNSKTRAEAALIATRQKLITNLRK